MVIVVLLPSHVAASESATGSIRGTVRDSKTDMPLKGVRISVRDGKQGAVSGADGVFIIHKLPPAVYTVTATMIGYRHCIISDVVVKPGRTYDVVMPMVGQSVMTDSIVVSSGYFNSSGGSAGTVEFGYEEIRRSPGSGGDVSRVLAGLPSVAKVNDAKNSLIVRGGSPVENTFYINNIPVPNINHFPTQGASGGPIGILNVDLLRSVKFSAGGFAPQFGNALSSVMELEFRQGSREQTHAQLDLNFAGYGAVVEGPLFTNRATWLFSARRSYLDLVIKAFNTGTSIAPRYGDYQGNISIDAGKGNSLETIFVIADNSSYSDSTTARENEQMIYGDQYSMQSTLGMNWKSVWGGGFSTTSLTYSSTQYDDEYFEQGSALQLVRNRSTERQFTLRSIHYFEIEKQVSLEFGGEWQYLFPDYQNMYPNVRNQAGVVVQGPSFVTSLREQMVGGFAQLSYPLSEFLTWNAGVRADYFSMSNHVAVQPRSTLEVHITPQSRLSFSIGMYAQRLPLIQLAAMQQDATVDWLRASHIVVGYTSLLDEDIQFRAEAYYKHYTDAPTDSAVPYRFLLDESLYGNEIVLPRVNLQYNGIARSYGFEVSVQKKLKNGLYGMASFAAWRSQYKDLLNVWRNRVYDNRFSLSVECGYKISETFELSARWIYAGGTPYTPFNTAESRRINSGVEDVTIINQARLPDYHSLNIRVDKRFNFESSSLVVFLSCWNVYNRNNVASVYWNSYKNEEGRQLQFGLLPIFGIEWEL
ncbi:MAG: TonB-dependent receptor [Candidatus Kapabacteria bacterium]|nr:TonB-dependent receptor [Candidatus Kapabacteria bacterium]